MNKLASLTLACKRNIDGFVVGCRRGATHHGRRSFCRTQDVFLLCFLGVYVFLTGGYCEAQSAGWTYARTESALRISIEAEPATAPGDQVPISVLSFTETWNVYVNDQGEEETEEYAYSGITSGTLTWEVLSGGGSFIDPPANVRSDGAVHLLFQTESSQDSIRVTVHQGELEASQTLDIDYWTFSRTESAMRVGLSAGSASGPGSQTQVFVQPYLETWDVYVAPRTSRTENHVSTPVSIANGSLTWSTLAGNGSFIDPPTALPADGSGTSAVFQIDNNANQVQVTLHRDGAEDVSESTYINFQDGSVSWSMQRTEALLNVSLSGDQAGPNVQEGTAVSLSVHADRVSWEVWESNTGTIQLQNYATSPASSAWCNVSSPSATTTQLNLFSGQLDGSGNAAVNYSMDLAHGFLRADVSYDSSTSGVATLEYWPIPNGGNGGGGDPSNGGGDPGNGAGGGDSGDGGDPGNGGGTGPNWQYDHVEGTITAQLTNDTSQGGNNLTTTVIYTSWEVWSDGMGFTDIRNVSSSPAIGANANFELIGGAGGFDNSSTTMDYNGVGHTNFSFNGGSDATVRVTAYFAGTSASASLYLVSSNTGGGGDPGNGGGSDPGNGGGGDPGNGGGSDPGNGGGGDSGNGGGGDPGNGGGGGDPWRLNSTEGGISVSLGSGTAPIVSVTYSTWEVWFNSETGNSEQRNNTSGPAINAVLGWSVSGDATATDNPGSTDINGSATGSFSAGASDSTVTVTATFAGYSASASATIAGNGGGGNGSGGSGGTGENGGFGETGENGGAEGDGSGTGENTSRTPNKCGYFCSNELCLGNTSSGNRICEGEITPAGPAGICHCDDAITPPPPPGPLVFSGTAIQMCDFLQHLDFGLSGGVSVPAQLSGGGSFIWTTYGGYVGLWHFLGDGAECNDMLPAGYHWDGPPVYEAEIFETSFDYDWFSNAIPERTQHDLHSKPWKRTAVPDN